MSIATILQGKVVDDMQPCWVADRDFRVIIIK